MRNTYEPLIQCDVCQCLRRHAPCGPAMVTERYFEQATVGIPVETGKVNSVELWTCRQCGSERAYGTRWA